MSIQYINGLGRHTTRALKAYGIKTVEQFSQFTEAEIQMLLGKSGLRFLNQAKMLLHQS